MFGRGGSQVDDDVLGRLEWTRKQWRGLVTIDGTDVRLALPGSKHEPDPTAVRLARSAAEQWAACAAEIRRELTEHRDTLADEPATSNRPVDLGPDYVAVVDLDRRPVLEFGFAVPWDDDHTLGARVVDSALVELSGSVLEP